MIGPIFYMLTIDAFVKLCMGISVTIGHNLERSWKENEVVDFVVFSQ